MNNHKLLKTALLKGGNIAKRAFYKQKKWKEKGKQDTVTDQDLEIHQKLSTYLENKSGIPVASEEGEHTFKGSCWILDPIDGTNNYLKSIPFCSVSLALKQRNGLTHAGVFEIPTGDVYYAEKGAGSWKNKTQIHVSQTNTLNRGVIVIEHGHNPAHRIIRYKYIRQHCLSAHTFGSTALDLAYMAAGHIDAGIFPYANAWDVAAGVLLIREAGGRVTNLKNKAFSFDKAAIVGSNRKIHKTIIQHIRQ